MKYIPENSVAAAPADILHSPHPLLGESPPTPDTFRMVTALLSKAKRFESIMNLMGII
jgi:hypothetical protein